MICRHCKKEYTPTNGQSKYCTVDCRYKAGQARNKAASQKRAAERAAMKEALKPIPCVQCGELFTPKNKRSMICSELCRYYYQKQNRLKPEEKAIPVNLDKYLTRGKIHYEGYCTL